VPAQIFGQIPGLGEKGSAIIARKNTAVFGIYALYDMLEEALTQLRNAGFRNEDMSVLLPENLGSKELATVKATKAPEGVAAGAGSGAVLGGVLGWLVGAGMLAIPGLGPLLAAGPLVAALAGIGAGGAVGGFTGALIGLGLPDYEAKRYEGRVRRGGILLSVHCDDWEWRRKAKEILKQTGAENIAATNEAPADFARSDRPIPDVEAIPSKEMGQLEPAIELDPAN
jgi:hypothetical protein